MTTPQDAVDYWHAHVIRAAHFNPDCECVVVLVLNTWKRIRGHTLISVGTLSEATAHPGEIFRIAVMAAAHSLILMHNHPSGEPDPSEADRSLTRKVKESGTILGIPLCDHIIVSHQRAKRLRRATTTPVDSVLKQLNSGNWRRTRWPRKRPAKRCNRPPSCTRYGFD